MCGDSDRLSVSRRCYAQVVRLYARGTHHMLRKYLDVSYLQYYITNYNELHYLAISFLSW